jgi:hypothetical protein
MHVWLVRHSWLVLQPASDAASAKTWKQGKWWELEEHELGPEPKKNPGPPFAMGDVIMCHVRGTAGLQRAFILSADHPKYPLH